MQTENYIKQLKDFKEYLEIMGHESTSEQRLNHLYETDFTITHEDHQVHIHFDAEVWHSFVSLMDHIIEEV
jgi:hypothetical protein